MTDAIAPHRAPINTQILLASRPAGWPEVTNFEIRETAVPSAGQGEFLVKNLWLSLDPYMRGRMSDAKSYAAKVELGEVMIGAAVGQVVETQHPNFAVGDTVVGLFGWQEYSVSNGKGVSKIDTARMAKVPLSAYLGAVGMPGVTAYVGLLDIGKPKAGETVCVSAASGAVGSVVGQIAKIKGCRVVGIAGGPEKCAYVERELGFDVCIDYKAAAAAGPKAPDEALRAAAPQGIDVSFENVGGEVLDAVLKRLNAFARIPLCGLVSQYNETRPYPVRNFGSLLSNRVHLEGFIVSERGSRWPEALAALGGWVAEGKVRYRESVAEGIRSAPAAFIGMLRGDNFGKQLVKFA